MLGLPWGMAGLRRFQRCSFSSRTLLGISQIPGSFSNSAYITANWVRTHGDTTYERQTCQSGSCFLWSTCFVPCAFISVSRPWRLSQFLWVWNPALCSRPAFKLQSQHHPGRCCVTAHQGVVHVRPRCCAVVQFLMASKAEDCFPQPRSWRPLGGTAPGDQTPEGTAHNFGPFYLVEAGQWVWSTLKRRGSHSGVNTGSRKPQGHLVLYKLGFI